jgi:hypothetical protein
MLNLPNGKASSIISDLSSGISQLRQQVQGLKSDTGSWVNVLGSGTSKLGGGSSAGSNQVAPYPKFSVDNQGQVSYHGATSGGGALVFNQNAIQPYQQPVYAAGNGVSQSPPPRNPMDYRTAMSTLAVGGMQAMPGTKEGVDYQLALSRMVFYQQQPAYQEKGLFGMASLGDNPFRKTNQGNQGREMARRAADDLMKAGTATNKFDAVNAYATAAQYGLSGPNMQSMMMGNAAMSNLTPGIGLEGATRAYGAMQQGRNVNMLRGIGIKIRGEDGSMKPMPQIIDELWRKLNREKVGGSPLSVDDVRISLQPGNALASMLDQYFGNDPLLRKQVEDGLIFKARTGGAAIKGGAEGKKAAEGVGATTAAVSSLSQRTAESTKTLGQVADALAAGFTEGNRALSRVSGMMNFLDRWTGILKLSGVFKGLGDTLASGGNFMVSGFGSFMGGLKSLVGKADGGPVEGKTPYIVGERGPELFMPKVDGTIVPNHDLKNYPFRDGSGGRNVTAGGYTSKTGLTDKSTPDAWAKAMLTSLSAPVNSDSIDALKTWARFEGGHFNNSAAYNPLNTSLKMPGSGPMSAKNQLVQKYANWDDGIAATVTTLTGKNAESRGYAAIVEALRKGQDKETILAAINKSAWVHGEGKASNYKFNGSSAEYNGTKYGGGSSGGGATQSDGKFSMREFLEGNKSETKSLLSNMTKGSWDNAKHAATATTYNYGGVSIKIDGSGNPGSTVEALKAALSSQETISKAANF